MKKKIKRIIAIFVAIPVLIISIQVVRRLVRDREEEIPRSAVTVVTGTPEVGTLEYSVMYSGTLMPEKMVTVLPKSVGKLESLVVNEGDELEQGDLIGYVDKDVARLQMEQAFAAYQGAEADRQAAKAGGRGTRRYCRTGS